MKLTFSKCTQLKTGLSIEERIVIFNAVGKSILIKVRRNYLRQPQPTGGYQILAKTVLLDEERAVVVGGVIGTASACRWREGDSRGS